METLDLPLIWAMILALAVLLYVVLDGFDLGIGILFPLAMSDAHRDTMMNSIAPVWDGNETWLVLGGGGLFAAFPLAYAVFMPAVYMPIGFMLTALIFRGVAFEFRFKARPGGRKFWDVAFHLGSVVAALAQGLVLGTFIQGIEVRGTEFAGGSFDWLTPFTVMVAVAIAVGYALLGATWVIMKSDGELSDWARRWALRMMPMVVAFMAAVSFAVLLFDIQAGQRWGIAWPAIDMKRLLPLYAQQNIITPVPIAVAAVSLWLFHSLRSKSVFAPFFCAVGLFLLGYLGLAISLFPYVVPYQLDIWRAAAAPNSLAVILIGVLIMLPLILTYTAYVYWVFRGKSDGPGGYGHTSHSDGSHGQTTA